MVNSMLDLLQLSELTFEKNESLTHHEMEKKIKFIYNYGIQQARLYDFMALKSTLMYKKYLYKMKTF